MATPSNEEISVRSHDVIVASGSTRAAEFESLTTIGAATRLAVNLRGMPPVDYALFRSVAIYRLGLQPGEVRPALSLLEEAEMVELASDGSTIKTVFPTVPYFQDLYKALGAVGTSREGLNEHEQLTLALMSKLGSGPVSHNELAAMGAEPKAIRRVVEIGGEAGFILPKRARGQDIYISPGYFAEDPQALANLATLAGVSRLGRVLDLIKQNQGYPLKVIAERKVLGGYSLDEREVALIRALAGEGFIPPPSIRTSHSGENHFVFGPTPGTARLPLHEKQIFQNALALVSAVRQGQFLARRYAVRNPFLLLSALLDRGEIASNSEAMEQYRSVVMAGVARPVPSTGDRVGLQLIRTPENERTVRMAIAMVEGTNDQPGPDEELVLAMRKGEQYVEPLLSRKALAECKVVGADAEAQFAIETFLLKGRS